MALTTPFEVEASEEGPNVRQGSATVRYPSPRPWGLVILASTCGLPFAYMLQSLHLWVMDHFHVAVVVPPGCCKLYSLLMVRLRPPHVVL